MFIAALFIIASNSKQPRHSSVGERQTVVSKCNGIIFVNGEKRLSSLKKPRREFGCILFSERSPSECLHSDHMTLGKGQNYRYGLRTIDGF